MMFGADSKSQQVTIYDADGWLLRAPVRVPQRLWHLAAQRLEGS
jgi:hypothetical protein